MVINDTHNGSLVPVHILICLYTSAAYPFLQELHLYAVVCTIMICCIIGTFY